MANLLLSRGHVGRILMRVKVLPELHTALSGPSLTMEWYDNYNWKWLSRDKAKMNFSSVHDSLIWAPVFKPCSFNYVLKKTMAFLTVTTVRGRPTKIHHTYFNHYKRHTNIKYKKTAVPYGNIFATKKNLASPVNFCTKFHYNNTISFKLKTRQD